MTKRVMHECPVDGCERNVGEEFLMCRTDWWRVSPDTKADVYRTFQAWAAYHQDDVPPPDSGHEGAWQAYQHYRQAAIDEANESRRRNAAKKET